MEALVERTCGGNRRSKERASLIRLYVCVITVIVGVAIPRLVTADVWSGDWVNKKRKIKYWYKASEPQAFKDDVDAAATKWNDQATGWSFNKGTEADHNVEVKLGQTGGANGQMRSSFPSGGPVSSATVTINKNGTTGPRQRTIEHELGHCMRLKDVADDGNAGGDLMEGSQGAGDTNLDPTANDLKEAKDAAATNQRQASSSPPSSTQGQLTPVTIVPAPGVHFLLSNATMVNLSPIDPLTLSIDPGSIAWAPDADVITANMTPLTGAAHNEFYRVDVFYADSTANSFDGMLIVTATPPPAGLPHAVIPFELFSNVGAGVIVDGSGSFHDDATATLLYAWIIDNGVSGLQGGGTNALVSFANPGDHTVTLLLEDEWGRRDFGTTIVHVLSTIPAVSEWGLVVLTLLSFVIGTLVIGATRQARDAPTR